MKTIPLSNGQQALVDDIDFDHLKYFHWSLNDSYPARGYHEDGKLICIKMHQQIMGKPPPGLVIDHINGDPLDNRRQNLRFATIQQNVFNTAKRKDRNSTSKYKGVHWRKDRKRWVVHICKNGKKKYLGSYKSEKEAALVYNKAAQQIFGDYARLNEINEGEEECQ